MPHPYEPPNQAVGPTPEPWKVHPHGDGDPCASYTVYAGNYNTARRRKHDGPVVSRGESVHADASLPTREDADFYRICRTTDGFRRARADAYLIAAAPELEHLCHALLALLEFPDAREEARIVVPRAVEFLSDLRKKTWKP